ncbi:unnamed protein product [Parnassius apollo]|uniref:(apollo) hypothetical protein n=1 Tax=Parnassius apollo TaxID=110799 RepID=A0A8S3W3D1_PARAO|nr:unnamed protein product [Parnassius apollo]
MSESFDCPKIIGLIDRGIIPEEWRIMVAVPKEREFKQTDARCFGKMTFEMTAYQVVTESNIAETIFKYIKHQSMTLSEEQLTKTLNRMSCPGGDHDYIYIVIDFSSWCTHFRSELVDPLFRALDDLFGVSNLYQFTHRFPLISKLLFQDRYAPPDQSSSGEPIEGARCVHGPEAWLEGLRQKGWTLASIMIILLAAYKCDTTASLLVQGDNQVIVLRIPSKQYLRERNLTPDEYTVQFLQVLEETCTKSGIVIKVPESWRSRRLLEFGRRYFLDGVQVSGAIKKATRITSEANHTILTINAIIAGLFSSGASIAGDDESPIPAYQLTPSQRNLYGKNRHRWSTNPRDPRTRTSSRNVIHIVPGPSGLAKEVSEPRELFQLFVTEEMIDAFVQFTNADIDIKNNKYKLSKFTTSQTSANEIKALLGLLIQSAALKSNHLPTRMLFDTKKKRKHL